MRKPASRKTQRVILFLVMRKDGSFAQVSPGVSCWPVQKVNIRGRQVRAVEYAFPRDLITGLPRGVFGETETVDKTGRAQIPQRVKWIMADKLLPPMRPYKEIKPKKKKKKK